MARAGSRSSDASRRSWRSSTEAPAFLAVASSPAGEVGHDHLLVELVPAVASRSSQRTWYPWLGASEVMHNAA